MTTRPSKEVYEFLHECTDVVQSSGSKEIDKPISFIKLEYKLPVIMQNQHLLHKQHTYP